MPRRDLSGDRSSRRVLTAALFALFALVPAMAACGPNQSPDTAPSERTAGSGPLAKRSGPQLQGNVQDDGSGYAGSSGSGAPPAPALEPSAQFAPSPQAMATAQALAVQTGDLTTAKNEALTINHDAGGTVQEQKEQDATDKVPGWVQLTLSVPVDRARDTVAKLKSIGEVKYFTSQSTNVAQPSADVSADIELVQQTIAKLQQIYAQAAKPDDMVAVEKQLIEQNDRLQELKRQQQGLGNRVDTTTVGVVLIEKKPGPAQRGWVSAGVHGGWADLVATVKWLVTWGSWLAVWLVPFAVVLFAVRLGRRVVRRMA